MLHSNLPPNLTTKPNKIYYLTKNLKLIFSDAKVQLFSGTAILLPEKMQKTNIFLISTTFCARTRTLVNTSKRYVNTKRS